MPAMPSSGQSLPLSGVIVCKNEADRIGRCVASLLPVCAEIIVLDSGSTDDTIAIAIGLWMVVATQMALLIGITPLESAQRLGPVLAGELLRHGTDGWDVAMLVLSLPLAWRLGR